MVLASDGERDRAVRWVNCLITVSSSYNRGSALHGGRWVLIKLLGVDACNTALGVLIFSAAMNFGQSWYTVLAMFGCMCNALSGQLMH